jgi:hypothetical protein
VARMRAGAGCAGVEGEGAEDAVAATEGPDAEAAGGDCPAHAPEATAHSRSAHDIARGITLVMPRNIARSIFIRAKAIKRPVNLESSA